MSAFAPRRAGAADLDAIMAIERVAFPEDAWSPATMRADLESPHTFYLVVEEAGRVVGYAGLRAPAGSADADIQTIAISAESRTRGRGRTLLTGLLEEAHARGVRDVFLDVRDDNAVAQELYRSEGFVEVGRRPRYYQAAGRDAIVMRLALPAWAAARATLALPASDSLSRAEEIRPDEDANAATAPHSGTSPQLSGGTAGHARSGSATDAGACT
jgi:[ribosomal protein S18]-alanine N-acetyltransferase